LISKQSSFFAWKYIKNQQKYIEINSLCFFQTPDGLTTKIHMLTDALGRPLRFCITGGLVHASTTVKALLEGQKTENCTSSATASNDVLTA